MSEKPIQIRENEINEWIAKIKAVHFLLSTNTAENSPKIKENLANDLIALAKRMKLIKDSNA